MYTCTQEADPWGKRENLSLLQGLLMLMLTITVKPVLSGHSKRTPKNGFQYQLSLNEGQKYCRMLQWEHSAILSTCIKLQSVFNTFVLSIFEWPLKTGFTVILILMYIASNYR